MRSRFVFLLSVLMLLLAACGGGDAAQPGGEDDDTATDTATDTAMETEASPAEDMTTETGASGEATVAVSSSDLGDILVDGEGMTLYLFTPDEQGEPTCTDACAETWPVFEGPATAGEGADSGLLGTVEHPSGATQVTYNGWPLYHYGPDQAAGDTNGQGVGGNWWVVGPSGEAIEGSGNDAAGGY